MNTNEIQDYMASLGVRSLEELQCALEICQERLAVSEKEIVQKLQSSIMWKDVFVRTIEAIQLSIANGKYFSQNK